MNFCFSLPMEAAHKIWPVSEMFENKGHVYVYSSGAGAHNPLGSKYLHKHRYYDSDYA